MFFLFRKLFSLVLIMLAAAMGYYFGYDRGFEKAVQANSFRDGVHLGFVHSVSTQKILFDDAVWLSGKAGQDAAIKAGHCTEETRTECLPNDYFISNTDVRDEDLKLDPNVLIFMKTYDAGDVGILEKEISLSDFTQLVGDASAHWNKLPYNITVQNGMVVRIEEIYIP